MDAKKLKKFIKLQEKKDGIRYKQSRRALNQLLKGGDVLVEKRNSQRGKHLASDVLLTEKQFYKAAKNWDNEVKERERKRQEQDLGFVGNWIVNSLEESFFKANKYDKFKDKYAKWNYSVYLKQKNLEKIRRRMSNQPKGKKTKKRKEPRDSNDSNREKKRQKNLEIIRERMRQRPGSKNQVKVKRREKLEKRRKIVLIGDSIIDNSYWFQNDSRYIGNNNTGQELDRLFRNYPDVVLDHSTEEVTSSRLLDALENHRRIKVLSHYVAHRKRIGHPYPGRLSTRGDAYIPVTPNELNIGKGDIVFLSVGGNDVALDRKYTKKDIKKVFLNVLSIINIYETAGAEVVYITPYKPTHKMSAAAFGYGQYFGKTVNLYDVWETVNTLVKNHKVKTISL